MESPCLWEWDVLPPSSIHRCGYPCCSTASAASDPVWIGRSISICTTACSSLHKPETQSIFLFHRFRDPAGESTTGRPHTSPLPLPTGTRSQRSLRAKPPPFPLFPHSAVFFFLGESYGNIQSPSDFEAVLHPGPGSLVAARGEGGLLPGPGSSPAPLKLQLSSPSAGGRAAPCQ